MADKSCSIHLPTNGCDCNHLIDSPMKQHDKEILAVRFDELLADYERILLLRFGMRIVRRILLRFRMRIMRRIADREPCR